MTALLALAVMTHAMSIPGIGTIFGGSETTPEETAPEGVGKESQALAFPVSVGGQAAKPVAAGTHATIADPVAANATVTVGVDAETVIVNIFPSDEKGTVDSGATPKIIVAQNTRSFSLDQTMDKTTLTAGTYLMNVVASPHGTARIVFVVK